MGVNGRGVRGQEVERGVVRGVIFGGGIGVFLEALCGYIGGLIHILDVFCQVLEDGRFST